MKIRWRIIRLSEQVVESREPDETASKDKIVTYTALCKIEIGIFLQVISSDTLEVALK